MFSYTDLLPQLGHSLDLEQRSEDEGAPLQNIGSRMLEENDVKEETRREKDPLLLQMLKREKIVCPENKVMFGICMYNIMKENEERDKAKAEAEAKAKGK